VLVIVPVNCPVHIAKLRFSLVQHISSYIESHRVSCTQFINNMYVSQKLHLNLCV